MKKDKPNLDIKVKMLVNDIPGRELAKTLGIDATNLSHLLNDGQVNQQWHDAITNGIDTIINRRALANMTTMINR